MRKVAKLGTIAAGALALAVALVWLAPRPPSAEAVEASVTERQRHRQCDREVWEHIEQRARERADVYCEPRGGVDDRTLRWVHHDSPRGAEQLCVVHLHYGCRGALPGDGH